MIKRGKDRHTYKHGMWKSRVWNSWDHMKRRCNNPKDPKFPDYGARGINVCDRWLGENGFANFFSDMGDRPEGYSLDRINNEGNYTPENCKWSSPKEQANNRRKRRLHSST
jgi:hypothetical protein